MKKMAWKINYMQKKRNERIRTKFHSTKSIK